MALTDFELVLQAKKGDDAAFEELVYRYDRTVLSIALKYISDEDDAKDIYQEVFIRVFRGLKKFEMRSEFSTWLFRITTNVCLTYMSRRKEHLKYSLSRKQENEFEEKSMELIDESSNLDEIIDSVDLGDLVNDAVESLSPKQRMIFILKHYEGYKIREIALMINCKEGTVKKYLFDAVRNLRKKLKPVYESV